MTAAFDRFIEEYHRALDEIMRGSPDGYKRVYSRRDDITLANPFGPPVRGWENVARALEGAAANYRDGEATGYERIVTYEGPEIAYTVEIERVQAKVGGREAITPIAVRTTSIFRLEDGQWRVVHRHTDPIVTPRPAESVIQQESA